LLGFCNQTAIGKKLGSLNGLFFHSERGDGVVFGSSAATEDGGAIRRAEAIAACTGLERKFGLRMLPFYLMDDFVHRPFGLDIVFVNVRTAQVTYG
jgi:hypothetical protein